MTEEEELRMIELAKLDLIERGRRGLLGFTKYTFPKYEVNWHHTVICKFLNRFMRGEIKRAMIFTAPRHGKSELASRRLPALLMGMKPSIEIMLTTYSEELASDMTIDVQRIMDTPEYSRLFPYSRIMPVGSVGKYARNSTEHELMPVRLSDGSIFRPGGTFRGVGVGGAVTGRGANVILIDDPLKNREEADSPAFRNRLFKFYSSTLYTRLEKDGQILLTQTRWHNDDLAGRLIRLAKSDPEADQWEILNLPAIREDVDCKYDPRLIGEALWPNKYNLAALTKIRKNSARDWAALYQQRPTADDGNVIKATWFRYYTVMPPRFDQVIDSWDFAVKDKSGSDYTVGQKWGRIGANKYLIHQVRGRFSFPVACQKVAELKKSHAQTNKVLIEAKANGPAVKQTLSSHVSGIVEVEPRGDKLARANAISPEFEGGNVWFPSADIAPWIFETESELTSFPLGVNDDIVDSLVQGIDELRKASAFYAPLSGHGMGHLHT